MKIVKSIAVLMVAVVFCPIAITLAQPVGGSVFTYQGQLKEAGQPYNGLADVTFRLFDAEVGGVQIGADVALIKGHKSKEIESILGQKDFDEIIHRDNLVLLDGNGGE